MKKKAQSVLEYIIVLTAIIAAIVVLSGGVLRNTINNLFNKASSSIENAANKLP